MNIKCAIGIHKWTGCKCGKCGKVRDKNHKWGGCKCWDCGKTREQDHNWIRDCEKCDRCGQVRTGVHLWNGCTCTKCDKARDEEHDWNGCTCTRCRKTRWEGHDWSGCKCSKCGKTRDEGHDWGYDECRKCGKTGSDRNMIDVCAKCGGRAILFLCSNGKPVFRLTTYEMRVQANWCSACKVILCGSCVGVSGSATGIAVFRTQCPICGAACVDADESILM